MFLPTASGITRLYREKLVSKQSTSSYNGCGDASTRPKIFSSSMLHFLAGLCALFVASSSESSDGRPPVCSAGAIHIRQIGDKLKIWLQQVGKDCPCNPVSSCKEKRPPKEWIILASAGRTFLRACKSISKSLPYFTWHILYFVNF